MYPPIAMSAYTFKSIVERYFPSLVQTYRSTRDLLDRRRPSRKSPWGFTFAGHDAMALGIFEPKETEVVRQLLGDVDVLVNVGANVGYYCCHALSLGKPIIAAEPIPRNIYYLLKNIRDNNWEGRAEVFPVALSSASGILNIWGGGTGASLVKGWASISEGYVALVPVLTLDRLLGESLQCRKALILVDIEGAEYEMLKGAVKALNNEPRPIWMIEISTTEHQPNGRPINPFFLQTFMMFFNLGYRAYEADKDGMEVTIDIVTDVLAGRRHIATHNFIFK